MKATLKRSQAFNVEVLALSLMCCLLAGVVGLMVLNQKESDRHDKQRSWSDVQQNAGQLVARVKEANRAQEEVVLLINHARVERENRVLASRASEMSEKLNLVRAIAAVEAESERIGAEIEKAKRKDDENPSPQAQRMLGEYKGPYILLECLEDHAICYPGKERLSMNPSNEQLDPIIERITKAGFVAIVVRPSGWYGNSFDKLRKAIYERLDDLEKRENRIYGRSVFPLDSGKSILDYLPPEAGL